MRCCKSTDPIRAIFPNRTGMREPTSVFRFYPIISCVSQWFDKRRGLALGIVISGSSFGGICWPLVLNRLLDTIGFAWAIRVTGFICLGLLTLACWLIIGTKSRQSGQDGLSTPKLDMAAILRDAKYTIFGAGMVLALMGMFIPFLYLPAYGRHYSMNEDEAYSLISYLNAGAFISRIAIGFAADKLGR
jgi:MFS family permease